MNRKQKGFSLIELLIVVAIILIIAAIAIPNLLRARMSANQASAVGSVRTLATSNITYSSTWNNGFAPTLATLGGAPGGAATCNAAQLVDQVLAATGQKTGYKLTYNVGVLNAAAAPTCAAPGGNTFAFTALPINLGSTGQTAYCSAEDGVVRNDPTGTGMAAGQADTACMSFGSLQ
ncbi:MAG: prepilin-type N-terminal cleavage/methylation domain-containing protein [Candidatus Acidiferrales bacterium]|jgi:prepilin-type N-terminal cleavage/methylation domain-containing protein